LREQHKQQVEAAGALRVTLDEMRAKMADMVPCSQLLTAQAVAKSASEEAKLKIEEVDALQERLSQARVKYQALHGQMDSLQVDMADMVPRSQLLAAKTAAQKLEQGLDAKDVELASLKSLNTDLKEQVNVLRKDVDDVNAQLAVTVPKAKLLAAHEELSTARGHADAQTAEIARLEKMAQDMRAQLSAYHEELDMLKSSAGEKVPRVELLNAQAQLRELTQKLAALETEKLSLQAHNNEIRKQQTALKEEIEALKEKTYQLVPRAELIAANSQTRAQTELVADVQAQLQIAQADVQKLKEQLSASRQEFRVLKEGMADMVPKHDYMAAERKANELQSQLKVSELLVSELQSQLKVLRAL
jgi:chromosome segregation ATPase